MKKPTKPSNEAKRMEAVRALKILDSEPESAYDTITDLVNSIFDIPIALVTVVDEDRQWFKSKQGLAADQTSREVSFCGHAIHHPKEVMVIENANEHPNFHDNPLVTGSPHISFYAGAPILSPGGYPVGTLCAIDTKPRKFSEEDKKALRSLADQVEKLLELRLINAKLKGAKNNLQRKNEELKQFAYTVSHDLKSPLTGILSMIELINDEYGQGFEKELGEMMKMLQESATNLSELLEGLVNFHRNNKEEEQRLEMFSLAESISDIVVMLDPKREFKVDFPQEDIQLKTYKVALEQVLINLLSNAMKYSGESNTISIGWKEEAKKYHISVSDNGIGIAKEDQEKIFSLFSNLGQKDRNQKVGSGIGLATVKKLVRKLGGSIKVNAAPGEGSTFTFTVKKVA